MVQMIQVITHGIYVRDNPSTSAYASSSLMDGQQAQIDTPFVPYTWLHVISPHVGYVYANPLWIELLDIVVTPAPAPAPGGDTDNWQVATDVLNVRKGPGTNWDIAAQLKRGIVVTAFRNSLIVDGVHRWLQIASSTPQWFDSAYAVQTSGVPAPAPVPSPAPPPQIPPSSPGQTWIPPFNASMRGVGLNAGGWAPSASELMLISANDIQVCLMVAYNANVAAQAIPHLHQAGIKNVIVRAAIGEAVSTAQRYVDLTLPILKEYYVALGSARDMMIAVHNEPNLYSEGLGEGWQDGAGFAAFFATVSQAYRNAFPGCKIGFPAMSPGGAEPGIRVNEITFVQQAAAAVRAADWIGVHCYWQHNDGSDFRPPIEVWRQIFGNKPIVGTEIGVVGAGVVTSEAVLRAYQVMGQAAIPVMAWVLNGTGSFQNADWTLHDLRL